MPLTNDELNEKAKAVLPLLRRAVQLNVKRWDVEREIEKILGDEVDSFYELYDVLCVPVDEPTAANVARVVGMDEAKEFVEGALQ